MQTRLEKHFFDLAKLPLLTEVEWGLPEGFKHAIEMIKSAKKCFVIGNGGSASIASHMAEDFTKAAEIPMMAFNDASMITCFANDLGYENVFSTAIKYYVEPGDLVIAISSSGKSANILNGAWAAKEKGCQVITLSGFSPTNPLRKIGDINFYVPDSTYGGVEITHLSLLHTILDFICHDKT